jgi:hypothetical protein
MAHGVPDDQDVVKQGDVYRVTDLAELAARLRSMVSYNRYGDVVLTDDFSEGLERWETLTTGTGGLVKLTSLAYLSSGVATLLTPGSLVGSLAQIAITFAPLLYGPIGAAIAFRYYPVLDRIEFDYYSYDGIGYYKFAIWYNITEKALYYRNSDGVGVKFDDNVDLINSKVMFHQVKMVVNTLNGEYIRFYINNTTYVFDGIMAQYAASSEDPNERFFVIAWGYTPYTGYAIVDNFILTQNELTS